jgi:hypothetical protein
MVRLMRGYELASVEDLLGLLPSRRLAVAWEAGGWRGCARRPARIAWLIRAGPGTMGVQVGSMGVQVGFAARLRQLLRLCNSTSGYMCG